MDSVNFRGYALVEWNINKSYEANTLVKDSDGNMFLSTRKVNAGENLGYSNAWIPVIDTTALSSKVDELEDKIEALEAKLTATVGEDSVPFEFVYDGTSEEYGYKDANGDFAPFTHTVEQGEE